MGQGGKQAKTNVFANLKYIFGVFIRCEIFQVAFEPE